MATDDERKLVAAALRTYDGSGATADTIGEITALIIGAGDDEGWTWAQVYARLADLIEPSDASQSCRDTVACDREALLALADEMDAEKNFVLVGGYARRIREACGEAAS